ncbi:MAG: hypothetical protein RIG62_05385 [Cyclobacteriaceae bacterium]
MKDNTIGIHTHKHYEVASVFLPENLLWEAKRQKNLKKCSVPTACLLDPDGDLAAYLIRRKRAVRNDC